MREEIRTTRLNINELEGWQLSMISMISIFPGSLENLLTGGGLCTFSAGYRALSYLHVPCASRSPSLVTLIF